MVCCNVGIISVESHARCISFGVKRMVQLVPCHVMLFVFSSMPHALDDGVLHRSMGDSKLPTTKLKRTES